MKKQMLQGTGWKKPEEKIVTARTPRRTQASSASFTAPAGKVKTARSTPSGSSSMLCLTTWPSMSPSARPCPAWRRHPLPRPSGAE